jgi:NAD(P)-dependent dehydrogenase (short-subunit alcohol dehydrogenase family)
MTTEGKIVVITGANAGIGLATAVGLAKQGASVAMVCRKADRGDAAMRTVASVATGSAPRVFLAELSSQLAVRRLSEALHSELPRIDVLINNAAAGFARKEFSVDGIEKTLAVNHLAPFLLTNLVLDLTRKFPAGRIVNVTAGIPGSPPADFLGNLQGEKKYSVFNAYRLSKIGNILFTYELARRLAGTGITVNCLHPGPVETQFGQKAGGLLALLSRIFHPIMKSPEVGARTPIYLATSPEVANVTGGYFANCKPKKTARVTYDREIARKHWEISEKLTSLDWEVVSRSAGDDGDPTEQRRNTSPTLRAGREKD